jgi:hypothetical protein
MKSPDSSSASSQPQQVKRSDYSAPKLTLYGTVNELTNSGNFGSAEASSGIPTKRHA